MSTKFDSTYSAVVSMAEQMVGEGKYDSTYSAVLAIYQNLTSDMDTKFDSVYSIVVKIADGIESGEIDLGGGGDSGEIKWDYTPKYLPQLIRFVNGLGEIVEIWDFEDRLNKTELPELSNITLPDGTILYGNMWNFTLEEIKQSEIPVDVGMLYDSIDGNSYINIEITPENLNTVLFINTPSNLSIDWGDGVIESINQNDEIAHTYENSGNYLIKIQGDWYANYTQNNMGVTSYFNYPNFYYYNQIKYIYITSGDYSSSNQWDFQYLYNCEYLIFGKSYFNNPYFYIQDTGLQHSLNIPSDNNNVRIYILRADLTYITLPVSNSYYQEIVVESTNINNLSLNQKFLNSCKVAFRNNSYNPTTLNTVNFPTYITKTSSSQYDIDYLNSPTIYSVIDDKLYTQGADYLVSTSFYRNGEKVDWNKIVREIEQESYSSIVQGAFFYRTFNSIKLCDRLISIPEYCFQYSNINNIYLNEGLSGIGRRAFYDTKSTVYMPDNVIQNWGYDAFYYCGDIILKWKSVESLKNNYKHYIVDSGMNTSLLSRSLINDKPIQRFEILDDSYVDVQYIGRFGGDLFLGKQLQTIGGSTQYITGDIYYQGTLNEWLDISVQNSYTPYDKKLYVNSIINDDGSFSGDLIGGELNIDFNVSNYKFYGNNDIVKVNLSDQVTSIGNYAFMGCDSLQSITIPDSVTSIGDSAFHSCLSLKSINMTNIDDSLQKISGGTNLQNIKLTYTEDGHKLAQLRYYGYTPKNFVLDMSECTYIPTLSSTSYSSVSESNGYYLILVPESLYDEWISATNWSSLTSQIKPVPGK